MNMKFLRIAFAMAVGCLAVGTESHALTVSYDSNTIPLNRTNWSNTLNIPKFDPALGVLLSVQVDLFGDLLGNMRAESLDSSPATLTLQLGTTLTLRRPDLTTLAVVSPFVSHSPVPVSAFDGVIDWGGTSGVSFLGEVASAMGLFTSVAAGDLALFTGIGSLAAPVVAQGNSFLSGSSNLAGFFEVQAGAHARVTYTFVAAPVAVTIAAVPEPSTYATLLIGLAGIGTIRRLRK